MMIVEVGGSTVLATVCTQCSMSSRCGGNYCFELESEVEGCARPGGRLFTVISKALVL